ncbi:MAG: hypothetical protein NZ902_02100 [Acidilobaceae archaeon]|nr:hypothetical protein [Acidilobaceae archaeon]MCX8165614.1 hypothetical protein [Acidilobaceae archaeon]MDW7974041.1 hypothetical protein [Sulfolobales archaeon]
MESSQFVKVVIENRRVSVSGREHESSHVLLVGANVLSADISYEGVKVEAAFTSFPSVDPTDRDVLMISDPNSKYEVDVLGERVEEVRQEEVLVIRGELVSIKFEIEEETGSVIVKLPKLKKIKAKRLRINSRKKTTLNMITSPFTMGVMSVYNAVCTLKQLEESLIIEAQ